MLKRKIIDFINYFFTKLIFLKYECSEIVFFLINRKNKFYNNHLCFFQDNELDELDLNEVFNKKYYTKIKNQNNFFYLNSKIPEDVIEYLNSRMIYIDCKKIDHKILINIIKKIYYPIKNSLNSNWKCIQLRAWITRKNSNENKGPFKFHTDGMPSNVYKIMIYPNSINLEKGTIEIENHGIIESNNPSFLLFKNSLIKHRTIAGKTDDRPVIELTIVKSLFKNYHPRVGNINSTLPIL